MAEQAERIARGDYPREAATLFRMLADAAEAGDWTMVRDGMRDLTERQMVALMHAFERAHPGHRPWPKLVAEATQTEVSGASATDSP